MSDPSSPQAVSRSEPFHSASGASAVAPELAGARCAQHPDAPALTLCQRCGSYACSGCTVLRETGPVCRVCASRFADGRYGSWLAIGAGLVAFIGLGCAPLGPAAIAMAAVDLVRMRTGHSPTGGLRLDLLAIGVGLMGALLWSLVVYRLLAEPGPYLPY